MKVFFPSFPMITELFWPKPREEKIAAGRFELLLNRRRMLNSGGLSVRIYGYDAGFCRAHRRPCDAVGSHEHSHSGFLVGEHMLYTGSDL